MAKKELALTEERHVELLTLLEDENRLRSEHPQLAEYLQTAPSLTGTGDEHEDGAFDLRLVHYLTCDPSETTNPYWEVVEHSTSNRNDRRQVDGGSPSGSPRLAFAQMTLQDVYAYAIPSPETIDWIAGFTKGQTILDVGAGRGYWAAQLAQRGLFVKAYDLVTPNAAWFPVRPIEQVSAMPEMGPMSTLFLCWPPGWDNSMAHDALEIFERNGGNRLIYIGEPSGGKTASSQFFDRLAEGWELAQVDNAFVSWWNLTDRAQGWVRKS